MKRIITIMLVCIACGASAETNSPTREANLGDVEKTLQSNLKKYNDNDNFFVRRGIIAERKKKIVTIQGEATGIEANKIAEFFVIDETSGHSYESIAIAFVKPGDVRDALLFIGMEPGRTIDYRKNMIWPKGERVIMRINGKRAEEYVYDESTKKPLSKAGLVFTGGLMIPDKNDSKKMVLAADVREPSSIAANYNENDSILDVPRSAPQKTTYGNNLVVKKNVMSEGKLIKITIEPEYKDGKKRVVDLLAQIKRDKRQETGDKEDSSGIRCQVGDRAFDTAGLIKHFKGMLEDGYDPFVTLSFDDKVPLADVKDFSTAITVLDTDDGIRLEPPTEGQLYHRAFNPPAHFLNRTQRMHQPLELFLEKDDSLISGTLIRYKQTWPDDSVECELEEQPFPLKNPEELRAVLDKVESELSVLFIHCPGTITHGELMSYVASARETHPIIHVFTAD